MSRDSRCSSPLSAVLMSNEDLPWQKRFRDAAILSSWEREVLRKVKMERVCTEMVEAWKGFEAFDISKELDQLVVDGWITLEDDVYQLAPDAPEFNIQQVV